MLDKTKYGFTFDKMAITKNVNRLTNQLWKLIPMRENHEDWKNHLQYLIIEISGFSEILLNVPEFISLLSKLEGLYKEDVEFMIYRKIVFESISLLREIIK